MRLTRVTALAGVATAATLMLTSCSESPDNQSVAAAAGDLSQCNAAETVLNATFAKQGTDAMAVAVAQLEKKYPGITINAEPQTTTNYPELSKGIVGDIAVGKRPDVIMSGLGQLRFWVDTYGPATIDVDSLSPTYQKQFLGAGTVDGKVYLAPAQISTPALMVNQTLLDRAGAGKASDIKNYDDMVAAAKKVTATTGSPSVSIPTNTLTDWFGQGFVQGAGGTFINEDGSAGFGDATGIEALSIWSTLAKDGLETNVNEQDATANFFSGKAAMMVSTSSQIANFRTNIGDKFDWEAVDLPTFNGQDGARPAGGNGWIVLSDDSCRAGFSQELVSALLSKEAVLAASGAAFSYIPVDTDAAKELLSAPGVTKQQQWAWTYDKPLTPWGGFDGKTTNQVTDTIAQMGQTLQTGADTASTVKQTVETINSIVGQG
ncbi:extracellular solute-binding protein [Rhodococcus sp. ARC_M6]|uniref:extracellular solute-binding protein n=1 Tax=Rhodococcus sp. ARC_M6 TaxID=2928852 RepID=UPI001FB40FAF|nr:extracellular solute-binding protein [Rhodococcus sp. ARC_M6]MCJ0902442.1 extracellular solute-binding protein [Rhodococcus sp. ARC_M6]